jgi:hypothetical protein
VTARVENQIEGQLARRLAPVVREMLMAEVERVAAAIPAAKPKSTGKADDEIMEACRQVANAVDQLLHEKFGVGEIAARRRLERTATILGKTLRRHGRMP